MAWVGIVTLASLTGFLAGCSKAADKPVATQPASVAADNQAKRIQDDPNMPPAAKAAALRSIQQNQNSGSYLNQAQAKQGMGKPK